jgi:putative flippase GtrA
MSILPRQFFLYILGGVLSAVADFGSYLALLYLGMWYVTANIAGNVIGFFTAFFLQKFLAFKGGGNGYAHFVRYCAATVVSVVGQTAVLYGAVEYAGISEETGKIISMGIVVLWNYFLYKHLVYV